MLRLALPAGEKKPLCRVEVPDSSMSLRAAGPLCLWLFETCSNACKHGLSKVSSPELAIELCIEEDNFVAKVGDNGPGLPESFSRPENFGLGLRIAQAIAEIDFRGQLLLDSAKDKNDSLPKESFGGIPTHNWCRPCRRAYGC